MQRTRIAVAGAGMIGRAHIAAARASGTVTLSAIVDPSPAAQEIAQDARVPLYRTLEELFTRDRPDGVVLATPNALHLQHAQACMAAGLPMLLEKPLAATVAEGRTLLQEAQQRGARILVGHHRAHSPIMAKARELVASGRLGRIVGVTGSATFHKPDAYFRDAPWRTQAGGGPILLNMIHEVHNLRMLCGEIAAVQAFASNAVRGYAVEDTVAISLRFAGGALGSFLLSDTAASPRSWEQTSGENPAYARSTDQDCYVVTGTQGSLAVPTMRLHTYAGERSWFAPFAQETVDLQREDPIRLQMEHFGAVVRGETAPRVSAADGLANLVVTEAIVEAARSGRTVAIG